MGSPVLVADRTGCLTMIAPANACAASDPPP